jgi:transposase
MASSRRQVTGGVDTHKDTHYAAVIDRTGRMLGDQQFPATTDGYRTLLAWLRTFGRVVKIGVEGTGAYGAGLARYLTAAGISVIEVDRPDRKTRRARGKSDPIDALAAAHAALSGRAAGIPKTRTGPVEAIRALRVARRGAVKARTAAFNQLHDLILTAPDPLRADLRSHTKQKLVDRCLQLNTDETRLHHPSEATKAVLIVIAARIQTLTAEIRLADRRLQPLVAATAPHLSAVFGVGPDVAGQLLTTAGDNPDRLRSEAALAHLCGVAPLPASSGRTDRHRLNRGGDRAANKALYTMVLARLHRDPKTRAYAQKRTAQGLSTKEIIRCLKRYAIREVYTALLADFAALTTP